MNKIDTVPPHGAHSLVRTINKYVVCPVVVSAKGSPVITFQT